MTLADALAPDLRGGATVEYPPGATYGPHTLATFELVWLLDGEADWHRLSPEGGQQRLGTDSLLLSRPGTRERFEWDTRRTTRHAFAHFGLAALDRAGDVERWPTVRPIAADDPVRGLLAYLVWLCETTPTGWRSRGNDVLRLLVATFVEGPLPAEDEFAALPPAIEAVAAYLAGAWRRGVTVPVGLAELAGAGSVSTGQLSRLFRERFGMGPVAAVERLRLARAEGLLLRSNAAIAAIARDCGFTDPYHFSKRFRHVYGVPPRAYRSSGGRAAPAARPTPAGLRTLRPLARRVWDGC